MSEERWELEVTPTAAETYEAMAHVGWALLSGRERALLHLYTVVVCLFAPIGATMIFWVSVQLSGGPAVSDLPGFTIPMSVVVFGFASFWLMRQSYFMMARHAVHSRFGRAYRVVIDAKGIALTTQNSRWQTGWADVAAVGGGKTVLAIGISAIAIAVPRRVFLGPQDAEDALQTMRAWQEAAV